LAKKKAAKKATTGGKKKKKKSRGRRFFGAFFLTLFMLFFIGAAAGAGYVYYIIKNAEEIDPTSIYETLDLSTYIFDEDGNRIESIYYDENRKIATYDELPENLKNAFIAIEDKTFWTHKGVNIRRMFGAVLDSVRGDGAISGTSTITQQLARNVFLADSKTERSIKRKVTEVYYAYQIEQVLSKEEILTAYLNTIYLGFGCYGVDTAAKTYFSTEVENLTLEECAALAALPQAPDTYALLVNEEGEATTDAGSGLYANDLSQERRNLVLSLMEEQGYITAEEKEAATKPLSDFIKPGSDVTSMNSAFKDYLIETVTQDLMKKYDIDEQQATNMLYTKGLNIYSTLDQQAQKTIEKAFRDDDNFPSAVDGESAVEAAMVIVDNSTGKIKAMVGTRHANADKLFNRATNPRQPGSSIKPLAVYAPALQKSYEYQQSGQKFPFVNTGYDKQGTKNWGDYITVSSQVTDEKMTVNGETWPLNYGRTYTGKQTFRTAIQNSINTCAVKILAQVGVDYSINMLENFGITTVVSDTSEAYNDYNLAALALGAMTEGVTPLDMAEAYAAFPNGGFRNTPTCYTKVVDDEGNVILESTTETVQVMNDGVAWIMTDVLKSVVTDGIGYPAAISGESVGGKTGTTNDTYDIWFNGFTANCSASLWIGTDDNVAMNTTSSTAAALWGNIMGSVDAALGGSYSSMPDNVVKYKGEYYTEGTQPKEEKKKDSSKKTEDTDDEKDSEKSSDTQILDEDIGDDLEDLNEALESILSGGDD